MQATTAQLHPGRDTFEFDQGHVTKNQLITVRILLSECLAIQQQLLFVFILTKTYIFSREPFIMNKILAA